MARERYDIQAMTKKTDEDIRMFTQEFADILQQTLKEAHLLLVNNQFKAATILYEYILQYIPDNSTVHFNLANAYRLMGEIDKSIACYKRAEELNNNFVNYYADDLSKNPISFKRTVCIELSNLCNYSRIHVKCPLHDEKEPKVMPLWLAKKIIDELSEAGYRETLMFSLYNEPLIDPRMFLLLDYARQKLKGVKLHILTNVFFLTQEIMDDLIEMGVNSVAVSAYTDEEFGRLRNIKSTISYDVCRQALDNRKDLYKQPVYEHNKFSCLVPIKDLSIGCDGSVIICCFDWKRSVVFGNVKNERIVDILKKPHYIETIDNLRHGKRVHDICRRCNIMTLQ